MKAKILFAVNNLSIGGAERMAVHQISRINRDAFEPWLAILLPESENSFSKDVSFLGRHYVRFAMRGLWDASEMLKVFRFLKQEKFDAVVTTLFFTNTVMRVLALCAGVPVIISHEQNMYRDKKRWQMLIDKILSYGTTKDVLEFTSRQEHIPREKFIVNYNTTPFQDFENLPQNKSELKYKLGISNGEVVFATAGRLIEQKGHIYLIQAAEELRKLKPDAKFKVVIFGDGSLRSMLEAEIKRLEMRGTVLLPGVWPAPDIMAVADIFVLPSLWEGLPVVLVEAMAAGKPCISSRVSGARELIEDKKSGLLVEPKNVPDLREKMFLLMFDANLSHQYGVAAKIRTGEFSIERHMEVLEELLKNAKKGE